MRKRLGTFSRQSSTVILAMAKDEKSAKEIFIKLYKACDHFLSGVSLDLVGFIPLDPAVRKAVINQTPFTQLTPNCPASMAITRAAERITTWEVTAKADGNIKFFWKKLLFQEQSVA